MVRIGILGGMGPQASGRLYQKIIKDAIQHFGARCNSDYPYFCLVNLPTPDLIGTQEAENKTVEMARQAVDSLKSGGYTHFAIACNTMHLYADEMNKNAKLNFISMLDGVVAECICQNLKTVSILGTQTTLKTKLYEKLLLKKGIDVHKPTIENQKRLVDIILHLIADDFSESDLAVFQEIVQNEIQKGSQKIILGCTELPLILSKLENQDLYIDSLGVLAHQINQVFYKQREKL